MQRTWSSFGACRLCEWDDIFVGLLQQRDQIWMLEGVEEAGVNAGALDERSFRKEIGLREEARARY